MCYNLYVHVLASKTPGFFCLSGSLKSMYPVIPEKINPHLGEIAASVDMADEGMVMNFFYEVFSKQPQV